MVLAPGFMEEAQPRAEQSASSDVDDAFEYVESDSSSYSEGEEAEAEVLEAIFGAAYSATSSPSKCLLSPAQRQSLLFWDSSLGETESGMKFVDVGDFILILFLHLTCCAYLDRVSANGTIHL